MDPQVVLYFRNGFREARDGALKDAEGYQQILFIPFGLTCHTPMLDRRFVVFQAM